MSNEGQSDQALLNSLNDPKFEYNRATNKISYLGGTLQAPIYFTQDKQQSPEEAAREFLTNYGTLFGVRDQARELAVKRVNHLDRGRKSVRFQQVYNGIPVIAGEMYVQLDGENNVISANGELLPIWTLDLTPSISADAARREALQLVAEQYRVPVDQLRATSPRLWIYDPRLLGAPSLPITSLVWRLDVIGGDMGSIQEFVAVDAHTGKVLLHFNQVQDAKQREVCDNNNDPSLGELCDNPVRREGDPPYSVEEVNHAYDYCGEVYDFYHDRFGRDSLDGMGLKLVSTVRYCPDSYDCPYGNAFWIPTYKQMVYGDGFASVDDVVGHELTHGLTQFTSGLYYYYQSGAINESLSDVFGELYDLTNNAGTDTKATRWLLGEDLPIGAVRNMKDPTQEGDPDRMRSPYYYSGSGDNGGVHYNSGVNNKAAYLMTDGGTFNGKTIRGLGIDKVAAIYYEVETNFLVSGSDYADLYVGLQQACLNLVGTHGITAADCGEVKKAVDATEMNLQPIDANASAPEAPLCPAGKIPQDIFYDNLENPNSGNWTITTRVGTSTWYYPQNNNPYNWDFSYATSGRISIWGGVSRDPEDASIEMTRDVTLPPNAYMHFKHSYELSYRYDGGVLEYSTDRGTTWKDTLDLQVDNGYNASLLYGASSYDNPLGVRFAFTGLSHGYISSRLDLSSLAGKKVRFRFRIGMDESEFGGRGWFIDDIRIYRCITPDTTPPSVSAPKASIQSGGTLGSTTIPLQISWAASDSSGIRGYLLQMSTYNNGAWSSWSTIYNGRATSITKTLAPGSYRFRVQATDNAGNSSTSSYTSTTISAIQENSKAISYSSGWQRVAISSAYGGYTKYHSKYGAKASLAFQGRQVAWIAPKGPKQGKAEVWIDGSKVTTVDLYASTNLPRKVVFSKAWSSSGSHTIAIKVLGTSGRPRVDVDAFVILR